MNHAVNIGFTDRLGIVCVWPVDGAAMGLLGAGVAAAACFAARNQYDQGKTDTKRHILKATNAVPNCCAGLRGSAVTVPAGTCATPPARMVFSFSILRKRVPRVQTIWSLIQNQTSIRSHAFVVPELEFLFESYRLLAP